MAFVKGWPRRLFFSIKEAIGGTFALTSQNFTELNVKRGRQFFINEVVNEIPDTTNNTKEYLFRTGPDPIILKARVLKTNSDDIEYEVFTGGTLAFTDDGSAISIRNANAVDAVATQSQAFEDPTYTGTGNRTEIDWLPGSVGVGNRSEGAFVTDGFEKILPGNTEFLVRVTNLGSNPSKFYYFLSWYEGEIKPLGPNEELIPTN